MAIDVKKEFSEIMGAYKGDDGREPIRTIIYGEFGTGKTMCSITGRTPILVHSFDPGGSKSIKDSPLIASSDLAIDRRFEVEDPNSPTAYTLWGNEFNRLNKAGAFNSIGTFVMDSFTTYSQLVMNKTLLSSSSNWKGVPTQQDYNRMMGAVRRDIQVITSLPCDIVLTAHIDLEKDEVSGVTKTEMLVVGKLKRYIPLLFDELYVSLSNNTSKGIKYQLLTQNDGNYQARTRIGKGKFGKYEEPNLNDLYKKAGVL